MYDVAVGFKGKKVHFIKLRYSLKADFKHSINCKFSIACDTSLSKSVENSRINKGSTKTKAGCKNRLRFLGSMPRDSSFLDQTTPTEHGAGSRVLQWKVLGIGSRDGRGRSDWWRDVWSSQWGREAVSLLTERDSRAGRRTCWLLVRQHVGIGAEFAT